MKKNQKHQPKQQSVVESETKLLVEKLNIEREKRARTCWNEIQMSLSKHNCELIPVMNLSPGNINASININAK